MIGDEPLSKYIRILLFIITSLFILFSFPNIAIESTIPENEQIFHLPSNSYRLKSVVYFGNGTCVPYARARTGIEIYGSASSFIKNAESSGYLVTTTPIVGSIVVLSEGSFGHVAVVEEITPDYIIITEQNYNGLYVVNNRKIPIDYKNIERFIYFKN